MTTPAAEPTTPEPESKDHEYRWQHVPAHFMEQGVKLLESRGWEVLSEKPMNEKETHYTLRVRRKKITGFNCGRLR